MESFEPSALEKAIIESLRLIVPFFLPLSLFVPGLVYVIRKRKQALPGGPSKPGLIAGLLPITVSITWVLFFIATSQLPYFRHWFWLDRLAISYKFFHYLIVPITVPLFANLLWKKTVKSLKWERLALIGAFLASVIACENTPVSWTFTFMLIPVALLVLCIGFAFLRRPKIQEVLKT